AVFSQYAFFFSSRRRHTRFSRDWSSDVCSSDLGRIGLMPPCLPHRVQADVLLVDLAEQRRLAENVGWRAHRGVDVVGSNRGPLLPDLHPGAPRGLLLLAGAHRVGVVCTGTSQPSILLGDLGVVLALRLLVLAGDVASD